MNNKSNKKNKSLQKGLFFAISSELEKAIGRKADWAAGAEPDALPEWVSPWSDNNKKEKKEAQKRVEEQRKRYADRFGSGEVSDSEFEEDEKNPVKYIPKPGDSPQAVRTEDERKDLRAGAKLTRDQTYGTKGKEPVRESVGKRNRERFLADKGLPDDTEITNLGDGDRKEYRESMKYAPKAESAEDRVWRNLRGGMTADSFEDPEDQEAYKRLSERFRDSKAGKNAKGINKDAKEAEARGEEPAKYGDPARTSNPYRSDRRDRVRIVREPARPTDDPAGPKPPADDVERERAEREREGPSREDAEAAVASTRRDRGSAPVDSTSPADRTSPADPKPDTTRRDRTIAVDGLPDGRERGGMSLRDAEARVRRGPKVTVDSGPKRLSKEEVVARFNDLRDRGVLTRRDDADRLRFAIAQEEENVARRGSERLALRPSTSRPTAPSSSDTGPYAPRSASILNAGISSNQFNPNSGAVNRTRQGLPTETSRLSGPTASGLSRISQVIQSDQARRRGRVDVPTDDAGSQAEELTGRYQAGKLSNAAAARAGRMADAKRTNDDAWTTRGQTDPRAANLLQHQKVVASKTAADAARPQFAHGLQDIHAAFLGGASLDEIGKMTRQQKSLSNIERDANRLSKEVNKSFKKKH